MTPSISTLRWRRAIGLSDLGAGDGAAEEDRSEGDVGGNTLGGTTAAELHEISPREQVGPITGERFEFQYHQAAADCLQVLDDTQVACVYCEWHDDYVIEAAGVVCYRFHQVKTRAASKGPWTLNEFFGVKRPPGKAKKGAPKTGTATPDSIFGRFYDHISRFGTRCDCFVFVTDAGAGAEFVGLLDAVRVVSAHGALSGEPATEFAKLHGALVTAFGGLSPDDLFAFVKRLHLREAVGKLGDLKACRTLIGGRIHDMSEVDLTMSEAQKIGADLVAAVRERSHRVLPTLPATTGDLRRAKGLVLQDVLRILSLSNTGYRELKAGGRDAVVALSRLHRLCKRSGVTEALIPELCRLKTTWGAWWIAQRHSVNLLDQIALKKACADALRVHADGKLDFNGLRSQAKALAAKFAPVLTSSEPLTAELVFGFMMAIAVEADQ